MDVFTKQILRDPTFTDIILTHRDEYDKKHIHRFERETISPVIDENIFSDFTIIVIDEYGLRYTIPCHWVIIKQMQYFADYCNYYRNVYGKIPTEAIFDARCLDYKKLIEKQEKEEKKTKKKKELRKKEEDDDDDNKKTENKKMEMPFSTTISPRHANLIIDFLYGYDDRTEFFLKESEPKEICQLYMNANYWGARELGIECRNFILSDFKINNIVEYYKYLDIILATNDAVIKYAPLDRSEEIIFKMFTVNSMLDINDVNLNVETPMSKVNEVDFMYDSCLDFIARNLLAISNLGNDFYDLPASAIRPFMKQYRTNYISDEEQAHIWLNWFLLNDDTERIDVLNSIEWKSINLESRRNGKLKKIMEKYVCDDIKDNYKKYTNDKFNQPFDESYVKRNDMNMCQLICDEETLSLKIILTSFNYFYAPSDEMGNRARNLLLKAIKHNNETKVYQCVPVNNINIALNQPGYATHRSGGGIYGSFVSNFMVEHFMYCFFTEYDRYTFDMKETFLRVDCASHEIIRLGSPKKNNEIMKQYGNKMIYIPKLKKALLLCNSKYSNPNSKTPIYAYDICTNTWSLYKTLPPLGCIYHAVLHEKDNEMYIYMMFSNIHNDKEAEFGCFNVMTYEFNKIPLPPSLDDNPILIARSSDLCSYNDHVYLVTHKSSSNDDLNYFSEDNPEESDPIDYTDVLNNLHFLCFYQIDYVPGGEEPKYMHMRSTKLTKIHTFSYDRKIYIIGQYKHHLHGYGTVVLSAQKYLTVDESKELLLLNNKIEREQDNYKYWRLGFYNIEY